MFLKYLAVNGIIQNWDTYGQMAHNFYLYNDPDRNVLTWIPWDNNESLQEGKLKGALALDFSDLDHNTWPLIAKIYADETYQAEYDGYLKEVIDGAFETTKMQELYDTYATLIEPYATTERNGFSFLKDSSEFTQAIQTLKTHASSRAIAVEAYLK